MQRKIQRAVIVGCLSVFSFLTAVDAETGNNGPQLPAKDGLALWLDASQLTGLTNGQEVGTWTDVSGRGNNATRQSTSNAGYPRYVADQLNGLPVLRFNEGDLSGDSFKFNRISNIRTVFWVVKERAVKDVGSFLLGDSDTADFHRQFNNDRHVWEGGNEKVMNGKTLLMGSQARGLNPSIPPERFVVISLVTTGDVQANQITNDRAFKDRGWRGDMAEILIYTKALSDDEEASVGRYLARKYGLKTEYPPEGEHRVPAGVGRLRAAIKDLMATFGSAYPDGPKFSARLDDLEKTFKFQDESKCAIARQEFEKLHREALVGNPLVSGQPLAYVVRAQYAGDHHNSETMFQTGECNTGSFRGPGALKTIDLKTGETKLLVDAPQGIVRDPEVRWDGKKIVFSMRRDIGDDYHLYEINPDGSAIKQLTFGGGTTDIDPFYLADGRIAFSSTREPKYCMCNVHIMCNLFVMEADGANIHQISKNTLHDAHGSLLDDGRILYDRWEYVDRNFGDPQGLWTVNPDGTQHLGYYGVNTPSPGGVIDARQIPGTKLVMAVLGSCHDRPWGALGIIDRSYGVDGRAPVVRTWPAAAIDMVRDPGTANEAWDQFMGVRPRYEDPFPLSAKYFLVSRTTGNDEQMGLYLLDIFGNEMLLHTEGGGCYDPQPIAKRPVPPVIPVRRDFDNKEGTFYVYNVYEGTHMAGVKQGAVKSLRVVESLEKRNWTNPAWGGQGVERPGMNWHDFSAKRILGTVPVETDGSAHFTLPSERFVYFQLLDERGMMIQSMRTGTLVQSGERTGCIGCHENRISGSLPADTTTPIAMLRPPSKLTGWHGPERAYSYMAEMQPVLDRNCVKCHDFGKAGGKKLVLAGDKNGAFNISYTALWKSGLLRVVGAGPAEIQAPYSWGSHASPLIKVILENRKQHNDVKLSTEDFDRLVTWVDLNAPYYPAYESNFPNNNYGRSPLDAGQTGQLQGISDLEICFDRPEMSPGLERIKSDPAKYNAALEAIRAGKAALEKSPRPDMPGFVPSPKDQERLAKYDERRKIELRNREAIRTGKKLYDAVPVAQLPPR